MCEECGKQFRSSYGLSQHILSHSDERPHKCDRCPMRFKKKSALSQHYTRHTGEGRKNVCKTCGKTFIQAC